MDRNGEEEEVEENVKEEVGKGWDKKKGRWSTRRRRRRRHSFSK